MRSESWFQRPLVALDVGAVLHVVAADATAAPTVRVAACTLFLHLAARGPEQAAALQVRDSTRVFVCRRRWSIATTHTVRTL